MALAVQIYRPYTLRVTGGISGPSGPFNMDNYPTLSDYPYSMLPEYTECFPNTVRSLPEHQNSYSENIWNGIRPSVNGPLGLEHGEWIDGKTSLTTAPRQMNRTLLSGPLQTRWSMESVAVLWPITCFKTPWSILMPS
jgi:hypothetical protein